MKVAKKPKNKTKKLKELIDKKKDLKYGFAEILSELETINAARGEQFKSQAYKKAWEEIMSYPGPIISSSDLKGKKGMGKVMIEKLEEYEKTGKVQKLLDLKKDPITLLTTVYGIGGVKAKSLVNEGCLTVNDLRERLDLLNEKQKIGLKYYDDIMERIPRLEIDEYKIFLEKATNEIQEQLKISKIHFEIVGSYRRGAITSGDIDIILTYSSDASKNTQILSKFYKKLTEEGMVKELLASGTKKRLVIGKLPNSNYLYRRIDFLFTSPQEYPFAILYFTGSKTFNVCMRRHALVKGYSLNEHGFKNIQTGELIENKKIKNEKDIFDFLELEYIDPLKRRDGRDIIIKKKVISQPTREQNILQNISLFKKQGMNFIETLDEKEIEAIIELANKNYRSEESNSSSKELLLTDSQYDILYDYLQNRNPTLSVFTNIGVETEKGKAKLPVNMPSMSKIKAESDALPKWKEKYNGDYIVSAKLDGISGLFTTVESTPKLFTRGDGKIGQDISSLIPYLDLPVDVDNIIIRGEFIIPKGVYKEKYENISSNPRNLVAGIINSKKQNREKLEDLFFVAYEVIGPSMRPENQFLLLKQIEKNIGMNKRFNCVNHVQISFENLQNKNLSTILLKWRENYEFEIDGIIVTDNKLHPRTDGNPKHSFAFKMIISDQILESTVVGVEWNVSKHGILKPRIRIQQVNIGGTIIEYVTAFNARYVVNNKIGIGTIVRIIRSGDVIPYIHEVVKSSDEALMPSVPYTWNETKVDLIMNDFNNQNGVKEKKMIGFFKALEVEGMGPGTIKKIVASGFREISDVINMSENDLLKIDGIQNKTANKLFTGIQTKIKEASLSQLMGATSIFGNGMGEKRCRIVLDNIPLFEWNDQLTDKELEQKIASIPGFALKTANQFILHLKEFIEFMKKIHLEEKLFEKKENNSEINTNHPLRGKKVVLSGFRDKIFQELLKKNGIEIGTSISSKTDILIVPDEGYKSGSVVKALNLSIPIQTVCSFNATYF